MDSTEQLARSYLETLGFANIVFEPDGGVPPDFLLDGRIAVEVRRLNQNVESTAGETEGLEESFLPLWRKLCEYLPIVAPSTGGESWYVGIRMSRPLEPWRKIQPQLKRALTAFTTDPDRDEVTLRVTPHLTIDLKRAGRAYPGFFMLGSGIDRDAGGFVVAEVYRNLQLCIAEKERKIERCRDKYPEWWLVLLDHIGYSLDSESRSQLRTLPTIRSAFSKVILVNPNSPANAYEV